MKKTEVIRGKIDDREYKFVSMSISDIVINATVFCVDEEDEVMTPMVIDEILNITDEFKAFSANGCRCGIDGMYVMRYY